MEEKLHYYFTVNSSEMTSTPPEKPESTVVASDGEGVVIHPDRMIADIVYRTELHKEKLMLRKTSNSAVHLWIEK